MSWDPQRLGFYCSRCDAQINMVFRQGDFLANTEKEEEQRPVRLSQLLRVLRRRQKKYATKGLPLLLGLRKDLSKLIQEFNSKARTNGEGHQGTGSGAVTGKYFFSTQIPESQKSWILPVVFMPLAFLSKQLINDLKRHKIEVLYEGGRKPSLAPLTVSYLPFIQDPDVG